jgi:hypothetical protein
MKARYFGAHIKQSLNAETQIPLRFAEKIFALLCALRAFALMKKQPRAALAATLYNMQ